MRHGASVPAEPRAATYETIDSEDPDLAKDLSPIEAAERQALVTAIRNTDGNMARAAALLQISRSTLYRRCRRLRIVHRGL